LFSVGAQVTSRVARGVCVLRAPVAAHSPAPRRVRAARARVGASPMCARAQRARTGICAKGICAFIAGQSACSIRISSKGTPPMWSARRVGSARALMLKYTRRSLGNVAIAAAVCACACVTATELRRARARHRRAGRQATREASMREEESGARVGGPKAHA
jgi:hypothetical protein